MSPALPLLLSLSLSLPFPSPSLFLPLAVTDVRQGVRRPRGSTVPGGAGDSSDILHDRGLRSVHAGGQRRQAGRRPTPSAPRG